MYFELPSGPAEGSSPQLDPFSEYLEQLRNAVLHRSLALKSFSMFKVGKLCTLVIETPGEHGDEQRGHVFINLCGSRG